jgi:hypothetical protein
LDAILVSSDTKNLEAPWICTSCKEPVKARAVVFITKHCRDLADRLVSPSVEEMEDFLTKMGDLVHENHVVVLDKKRILVGMYGGFLARLGIGIKAENMSEDQFKRKKQLCEELIKVYDILIPGRTLIRGMVKCGLYEALDYFITKNMAVSPVLAIPYLKAGLNCQKEALAIFNDTPLDQKQEILKYLKQQIASDELALRMMSSTINN